MKIKTQFIHRKLAIIVLTMLFIVLLTSTAFALPAYTTANSNSGTNVYCSPNSSSMVVGSIGVESVKVYWQESGYYYIEYVVSGGGYSGYKRGYVPTGTINVSGIGDISYVPWPSNTTSNQTVYDRPITTSYVIGTVYSTDSIIILQEDGSWYFIQYPITGGFKRGYVPKSTIPGNGLCLNIRGIKQEQTNWCWAATSKIVLSYLGQADPTQSAIVTSVMGSPVNQGASFTQDRASLTNFGLTTTSVQSTISWATLKDNISGWYSPVKVGIYWSGGGGHARVIYGYYENSNTHWVYYEDPWPDTTTWNFGDYDWFVSNQLWTWGVTHYYSHR